MKKEILVADDDELVRHLLRKVFEENGYSVLEAKNGKMALDMTRRNRPSLLILDLNLGDFSGLDICVAIKNDVNISQTPILILTGDDVKGQNITCLDQGADDYMTKPSDWKELVSRTNAILRRVEYSGGLREVLTKEGISIDVGQKVVIINERMINNLTPKEFDILYLLVKNSPNLVDREVLSNKVWNKDFEYIHERTIDVHIRRVRQKLGREMLGRLITLPGRGYKFI